MSQQKIRSRQVKAADIISEGFGVTLTLTNPTSGQSIIFSGSPLVLRNATVSGGGSGVTLAASGGLEYIGSPTELRVDSTVARTNIATETFSFAGQVALNLDDTTQGADEKIWQISSGGSPSDFVISTRVDGGGAGNPAITFERTGTTIDTATVPAPTHLTSSGEGTSSALHVSSNQPTIIINDNDGAVNTTIWDIQGAAGKLLFRTRTDAHGNGDVWLTVNRSDTTVGSIDFIGTALTLNGVSVVVGSPAGSSLANGTKTDSLLRWSGATWVEIGGSGSPIGIEISSTGKFTTKASTGTEAPINIPAGNAPVTPIQGDLYATTQGLLFVGHGSPHIIHDLTHQTVGAASTAVLTVNDSMTLEIIPGMSVDFISSAGTYLCEVYIRGQQTNAASAGLRLALRASGFSGNAEWTITEYDSTFSYGPITADNGSGSPITYPNGDTSSNDAQIRGTDFGEQGNLTSAVTLVNLYNDGTGDFICRGYAVLTAVTGGIKQVQVQAAQSVSVAADTSFSHGGAGKAWIKLIRI